MLASRIAEMNQEDAFIDSAEDLKKTLKDNMGIEASEYEIRQVMRHQLNMKFKKVVPISIHGNSEKNLVLRQQFAKNLIQLLMSGKTLLNVDESWIGMSDFRRRKWMVHGTTNSAAKLPIAPRISMIAGLDSTGRVYLSLVQSNSNGRIIEIFLRQLVVQLDKDRKDWRQDTVLVFDNAPYHTSKSTMKVLRALNVPVLYTGPHSYSGVPIELWFAEFKRCDINPRKLPTGKRYV